MTDKKIRDDENILYKHYYEMGVEMVKEDAQKESDGGGEAPVEVEN